MILDEGPKAIPLWIDGHAFLTVTHDFHEVRNARTGEVLRRVPLCGLEELGVCLAAARSALDSWAGMPATHRISLLAALGGLLAKYSAHFAGLLSEELGIGLGEAIDEIEASIALLCNANCGDQHGVVAIAGGREFAFLGALRILIPALAGGATAVICPYVDAPSALLALAELSGRCGFPDGVFNIVYGGQVVIDGLRRERDVLCLP